MQFEEFTKLLGDPHLGKRFINGVPLEKRGLREEMQWRDFESSLMDVAHNTLHVCMGDLFDTRIVPYSVVLRAAERYRHAAERNPDCTYVVIVGNHDDSRDTEQKTAFDVFSRLVEPFGVICISEIPHIFEPYVVIPWSPVFTAAEMVEKWAHLIKGQRVAFGHWDVTGGGDNLVPTKQLKALGIETVVTGHDHLRRELKIDDVDVVVTGSMQPYSHAEDPDGDLYVTMTLDEIAEHPPEFFSNKCVRVRLAPGEALPQLDCLQIGTQYDEVEENAQDVAFEAFDMEALFQQACEEAEVPEQFVPGLKDRYEMERTKQDE
jgi:DNA repair exonuclease SbcCD nuclease subunit